MIVKETALDLTALKKKAKDGEEDGGDMGAGWAEEEGDLMEGGDEDAKAPGDEDEEDEGELE